MIYAQTRSHRGPGRQYLAARKAKSRAKLNAFAEALAEGCTISAAARQVGISQQSGSAYFRKIRLELGPQAR